MLLFVYQVNLFHEQKGKKKKNSQKKNFSSFFVYFFPFNSIQCSLFFLSHNKPLFFFKNYSLSCETHSQHFSLKYYMRMYHFRLRLLDFHHFLCVSVLCFCCCYIYCYNSFRVAPTICHERMFGYIVCRSICMLIHPCSLFWLECY